MSVRSGGRGSAGPRRSPRGDRAAGWGWARAGDWVGWGRGSFEIPQAQLQALEFPDDVVGLSALALKVLNDLAFLAFTGSGFRLRLLRLAGSLIGGGRLALARVVFVLTSGHGQNPR